MSYNNEVKKMSTFTLYHQSGNNNNNNQQQKPNKNVVVNVIVEEGVTQLKRNLFSDCQNLQSVTLPSSIQHIHYSAFYSCKSLTSIELPSSLQTIGEVAFYDCASLQSIIIPNSITQLKTSVFHYCENLQSVTLPSSIQHIHDYVFSNCESLESIELPSSLQTIGEHAFYYCKSIQSIIIPNSITQLETRVFSHCKNLQSVILPSSIQHIHDYAFSCCESLTSIELPSLLQTIGESAFYYCKSLQSIIIPNSVTLLNQYAFYGCNLLQSIKLPETVPMIDIDECWALQQAQSTASNWLNTRFDNLALHQNCHNHNGIIIIDQINSIPTNDPSLLVVDEMGMTPLHVLCCNIHSTSFMIKQLLFKNRDAALVRSVVGLTPLQMYLHEKSILSYKYSRDTNTVQLKNEYPINVTDLESPPTIHQLFSYIHGLDYDTLDVMMRFYGLSIERVLISPDEVSGLYPYMSLASSNQYGLDLLYEIVMKVSYIICKETNLFL